VWPLLVGAVFSLTQLPSAPGIFYPDSTQYLARTYDLLGETPQDAREEAIQAFCDAYRHPRLISRGDGGDGARRADDCVERLRAQNGLAPDNRYGPGITRRGPPIVSERYEKIFSSRPAVAVLYAPGVAAFGARTGMWVTTLGWTVLGSVLIFLLLRVIGSSAGAAILGQILFLALPIRYWTMAPLAEGMTLALIALCLLGIAYTMTHRTRRGLILMTAGFGLGCFVKYSQFLLFALAVAGTAVVAILLARRHRRPTRALLLVTAASVCFAVLHLAVAKALNWPGGTETMQDLATQHFRQPDVADPVGRWMRTNAHFWAAWILEQLRAPLMILAWTAATWGIIRSRTPVGFAIIATLLAGIGNQIGHPNTSQADRLYLVAWLLTVCGLPLLIDALTRENTSIGSASPVGDRSSHAA
jgi:hypothetical protein